MELCDHRHAIQAVAVYQLYVGFISPPVDRTWRMMRCRARSLELVLSSPRFPTRRYPYKRISSHAPSMDAADGKDSEPQQPIQVGTRRFVLGLDPEPFGTLMEDADLRALRDPFALSVLTQAAPPLALDDVLRALNVAGEGQVPDQQVFMIAEGGQIAWSDDSSSLDRGLRVVFVRSRGGDAQVLVSTTFPFDDESDATFLQVAGWDNESGVFNFYERRRNCWFWAGNSWHALDEPTRGRGPFDSHANGALVMKELRMRQ